MTSGAQDSREIDEIHAVAVENPGTHPDLFLE